MTRLTLPALLVAYALSACTATLPPAPIDRTAVDTQALLKNRTLNFCETDAQTRSCQPGSQGLSARGLGGPALPLRANLKSVTVTGEKARLDLDVNNIGALCTQGRVTYADEGKDAVVSGIYCNWIIIGNVIASAEFRTDWSEPDGSFGGRYIIRFFGTGNGSGAGHFKAAPVTS